MPPSDTYAASGAGAAAAAAAAGAGPASNGGNMAFGTPLPNNFALPSMPLASVKAASGSAAATGGAAGAPVPTSSSASRTTSADPKYGIKYCQVSRHKLLNLRFSSFFSRSLPVAGTDFGSGGEDIASGPRVRTSDAEWMPLNSASRQQLAAAVAHHRG